MPVGRTQLVTGAGGFIGTQLVKRLVLDGTTVRALVRSEASARQLRSLGCEICFGDVTEPASVDAAVRGVDVVFHCVWGGDTISESRAVNVEGTRHVVMAAGRAGVRRVVHVSTFAVHDSQRSGRITESAHGPVGRGAYALSKAEAEAVALEAGPRLNLEIVVVRPTLVYGPGSQPWVMQPFWRVKHERIVLIDHGRGLANLVYRDDLVEGLILAATTPGVSGEVFLLSGAEPVTWRDYLGHFARMCGKTPPPSMSLTRARLAVVGSKWHRRLTGLERRLDERDVRLMTERCAVDISKARQRLGFVPRVTLDEGMARTEAWLRQCGYLPPLGSDCRPEVVMTHGRSKVASRNLSSRVPAPPTPLVHTPVALPLGTAERAIGCQRARLGPTRNRPATTRREPRP